MEQRHSQVISVIRLGELGQFAGFAAFMAFSFYFFIFAFGTVVQVLLYFSLALAIPLYAVGLRINSLRIVSLAWFVLGSFLAVSFATLNPSYSSPYAFILVLLVVLILTSYEQTRFSFAIDPVIHASKNFASEQELASLARVIRSHALNLFQMIALSILASAVVIYLSESVALIANPPIISVPLLVALAIIAIVSIGSGILAKKDELKNSQDNGDVAMQAPGA